MTDDNPTPEAIPVDPDLERDYLLTCYQERLATIQYDLNHAIEYDAEVNYLPVVDGDPCPISVAVYDGLGITFRLCPREARVLAARLLRAATAAELGSVEPVEWKFKKLEGVERVEPPLTVEMPPRHMQTQSVRFDEAWDGGRARAARRVAAVVDWMARGADLAVERIAAWLDEKAGFFRMNRILGPYTADLAKNIREGLWRKP